MVDGHLPPHVTSKDVILRLIGDLGADGASYCALEFAGSCVEELSVASRMTMANMAVEAGAKCALFVPDEKTAAYCRMELGEAERSLAADADAHYIRTVHYRAEDLVPVLACPSQVDKIRPVSELEGLPIDQVFLGSCTNGRLEDLMCAAEILKGGHVAPFVKLIVTPASRQVYLDALANGTMEILQRAGAIITHPGCGLCCGRTGGILTDGERVVATNNRNFLWPDGHEQGGDLPRLPRHRRRQRPGREGSRRRDDLIPNTNCRTAPLSKDREGVRQFFIEAVW